MFQTVRSDVYGMNPSRLWRRWWPGRAARASELPARTTVIPPSPWGQAEPVWRSLWSWLRDAEAAAQRPHQTLERARVAFAAALDDLHAEDALDLRRRGRSARSLRELWHLRAELYGVVARHRSQAEADRRMGRVNQHFPCSARPSQRQDAVAAATREPR